MKEDVRMKNLDQMANFYSSPLYHKFKSLTNPLDRHVELIKRLSLSRNQLLERSKEFFDLVTNYQKRAASEADVNILLGDNKFIEMYKNQIEELLFLTFIDVPYQIENIKKFENLFGFFSKVDERRLEDIFVQIDKESGSLLVEVGCVQSLEPTSFLGGDSSTSSQSGGSLSDLFED